MKTSKIILFWFVLTALCFLLPMLCMAQQTFTPDAKAATSQFLSTLMASPWFRDILEIRGGLALLYGRLAPKLEAWLSAKLAYQTDAYNSDHDQFTRAILGSKVYRVTAFALDLLLNFKMPSISTYEAQLKAQNTAGTPPK